MNTNNPHKSEQNWLPDLDHFMTLTDAAINLQKSEIDEDIKHLVVGLAKYFDIDENAGRDEFLQITDLRILNSDILLYGAPENIYLWNEYIGYVLTAKDIGDQVYDFGMLNGELYLSTSCGIKKGIIKLEKLNESIFMNLTSYGGTLYGMDGFGGGLCDAINDETLDEESKGFNLFKNHLYSVSSKGLSILGSGVIIEGSFNLITANKKGIYLGNSSQDNSVIHLSKDGFYEIEEILSIGNDIYNLISTAENVFFDVIKRKSRGHTPVLNLQTGEPIPIGKMNRLTASDRFVYTDENADIHRFDPESGQVLLIQNRSAGTPFPSIPGLKTFKLKEFIS